MEKALTLFGYGEAGQAFARAAGWEAQAQVFDIKTDAPEARDAVLACYEADGVSGATNPENALRNSRVILSLVTADQALAVAQHAALHILPNALYFDMNSVAPDTKLAAAKLIDKAGARYVDVAVMAPVHPARLAVPLLVSGPHAGEGVAALADLGFTNLGVVNGDIGQASAIKMIRSIMVKGQEALTAEMMLAARAAGVVDEVLGSLGDGWDIKADYNIERMRTHGIRRAAEMKEVAKTLTALGVNPVMTNATVKRQREMAEWH